jgi:L-ascorbate metabolism protein UlaG (beta-lactamase superfamily)
MDARRRAAGLRKERSLASPRFHEGLFRNTRRVKSGPKPGTSYSVARDYLFGREARRPPRPLPAIDPRDGWARTIDSGFRATWLGHSTVLLELDGTRVLTDPVWSDRISPFGPAAPRRFQPVPIPVTAVPELDAIVISHDHFDHLDHDTIVSLTDRATPFVVPLGVGMYLEAWGIPPERVIELDWWESTTIGGVRITATPCQHFSGRGINRNKTLWASMVIESEKHKVFFSGDTALTPEFEDIRAKFGKFDLVMLEIGGFDPRWDHVHLGPLNALEALRMLGGGALMPVHWGTFNLALHAWDWPAETLIENARDTHLLMPRLGLPFEPVRGVEREPWWRASSPSPSADRTASRSRPDRDPESSSGPHRATPAPGGSSA